jgi:hypothetical protein
MNRTTISEALGTYIRYRQLGIFKTMRVSNWGKVTSGLFVSVLAGCGGGHGGGGYGGSPMNPAPTVSFSQPAAAATINFGQSLTVAWTSAYTTSCTATASSAAGGAFTGTQMTSGSMTVVPTAAGNYTYTLSCTGTGGTKSASASVTVTPNILNALAPPAGTAIASVGSTVDPNGDLNPYGLVVAPATAGLITKGDLVVCNFNNAATTANPGGVQGLGTTIIGLHPGTGSKPYHIAQSANLTACNALTMLPDDTISAAAWSVSMNPLVSPTGAVTTPFASDTFNDPWGEAYVAATATQPAALYISNAPDNNGTVAGPGTGSNPTSPGTIDRITLDTNNAQTAFTEIVTGFCSGGTAGTVFGPSGLTYDPASDTLYVIDTASASVIALTGVSSIPKDGVVVNGKCTATTPTPPLTFSGPSMASAKVIAHGSPLSAPISAALLKNGDLVVGNGDIVAPPATPPVAGATTNLLIEVSPVVPGGFVGQLQIDTGAPGAIFGIAATVDAAGNQIIYFNNDNNAAVMQLGPVASTTGGGPGPY